MATTTLFNGGGVGSREARRRIGGVNATARECNNHNDFSRRVNFSQAATKEKGTTTVPLSHSEAKSRDDKI